MYSFGVMLYWETKYVANSAGENRFLSHWLHFEIQTAPVVQTLQFAAHDPIG